MVSTLVDRPDRGRDHCRKLAGAAPGLGHRSGGGADMCVDGVFFAGLSQADAAISGGTGRSGQRIK